jgi:hypothetical protein
MSPNCPVHNPLTMPDDTPLMDGFAYNPAIRYTAMNYYPMALAQLEIIRRANLMRPRWFVYPDDQDNPIAAYQTFEYQCSVAPGSYLWAINAVTYDEDYAPVTSSDILLQLTDSCTGVPLFSDFVTTQGMSVQPDAPVNPLGYPTPQLLAAPRLILEPGLVTAEIANRSASAVRTQIVLYFAEPCLMTGEGN